jgi:DNA-binding FrmR family transcriptional regulator
MTTEIATHGYAGQRDALLRRVNRLEGQVRGVGRMIEDDRYCIDIVDQLSAIQAAARQLSLQILEGHVRHCVMDAAQTDDAEPKLQELMETLSRAMGK